MAAPILRRRAVDGGWMCVCVCVCVCGVCLDILFLTAFGV